MQVPKIENHINMGIRDATTDTKNQMQQYLNQKKLSGQKPLITKAKNHKMVFKLRRMPIGTKVTFKR